MTTKAISRPLLLACCLAAAGSLAWASTIQGVVTDSSGALVPGATVSVTNLATGVSAVVSSNDAGLYTVPLLQPGEYSVECESDGFAPQARPQMRLEVDQTARVDFALNVGTVTEVVQVSAAAQLLQSETTEMGQVIDNTRIVEMPLNLRNYLQLGQFTVGVLPARAVGKGSRQGHEGGFQAIGLNPLQNNVLLDGMDNSSRGAGGGLSYEAQSVQPSVDAVSEFKVVTNNTSAEYGYKSGAKILVSTKSGTNQFHGSAFEFLRNDKLDGTNFFANRTGQGKPSYRQNQFGGTIGGPIVRNRTFFFASYQGTRIRLGKTFISSVPSTAAVAGDFSEQPAIRRNVFDPLTISDGVRQQFPNNVVPASRFDPVSTNVANLYPAPTISGRENAPNNFLYGPSEENDTDQHDYRVDHNITDRHRFFARASFRDQFRLEPGRMPLPADGASGQNRDIMGRNFVANVDSTMAPTIHNNFRFGFSRLQSIFNHLFTENMNSQLGILNAPGDSFDDGLDQGYPRFTVSGFNQLGPRQNWPNTGRLDTFLFGNTVLWQKGRHSIRFGAEYRHVDQFRQAERFRRGWFQHNGVYTAEMPNSGASRGRTGNGLADLLLGWASNRRWGNQQGENVVERYMAFFLQDDFKVTSNLTLNLGMRYEVFREPVYPNPDTQTSGRYLTPEVNGVAASEEGIVFPRDGRDCGCVEDLNNFGPRIGVAYKINDKTVIRTGGGVYFGGSDAIGELRGRFWTGPPRHVEILAPQRRTTTEIFVKDGFPDFVVTDEVPRGTRVKTTPDKQPVLYSAQWFLDIQHNLPGDMLLTLAYLGQSASQLAYQRNVNKPIEPHPTTRWQARRIRPYFNDMLRTDPGINSNYNALTVKAEKRLSQGLTLLSSFTWSHNIDFSPERWSNESSSLASDHNASLERGNSDLDRRLAYNLSWLYEIPLGQGRRWMKSGPGSWILGNWQVGGILALQGGMWSDHRFNVDNQNLGGRVRGDAVANPNLPAGQRTIDRWFNTENFVTASAPGVISNAGRNLILMPTRTNYDFILAKQILLPAEGQSLQFRFESFNFTNTPQFGRPNTNIGTPAAGRITQADEPRRIQFGLRYLF